MQSFPDDHVIHSKIVMHNDISHIAHLPPRKIRVHGAKIFRQVRSCFADNDKVSDHSVDCFAV